MIFSSVLKLLFFRARMASLLICAVMAGFSGNAGAQVDPLVVQPENPSIQPSAEQPDPLLPEPIVVEQAPQTAEDTAVGELMDQLEVTLPVTQEGQVAPQGQVQAGEEVALPPPVLPADSMSVEPAVVGEGSVSAPPVEQLVDPQQSSEQSQEPSLEAQPAEAVSAVPALAAEEVIDENVFFDAETLVPEGEMAAKSGPKKVNPALQPASKFVVVRENHSANSRTAQLTSAERAIQLGRYESAGVIYDKLLRANPKDDDALLGLAVAYQRTGRADEAISAYEKLLDRQPGNLEARVNMLGLIGARYPASALAQLEELLQASPGDPIVLAQMAVLQADVGQYNEALQSLGVVSGLEPENAVHLFNIAVIADRAGKKQEAIKYYEEALEKDTIYGGSRSIPRESVFERLAQLR